MQTSLLVAWLALVVVQCEATPSPIIIVPGLMGSQLQVKDSSRECATSKKGLWVWLPRLLAERQCSIRELSLSYDPATDSYNNNTNVKITVPGFGNTSSVEYLDQKLCRIFHIIPYFRHMVKYFVNRGYKRGKSIRAAPYDWRLAADELEKRGYFHQLKSLVEKTYQHNGDTKVTLVTHSMGGLVSLHFLTGFNGINQAWKNKYIHAYVPLATPWSGAAVMVEAAISGYYGLPKFLKFLFYDFFANFFVSIARTFESTPWLLPKPSAFGDTVLVSTPSKHYTASDYKELFRNIKVPNFYRAYESVQAINPNFPAPNVPTYCLYGIGVDTTKSLKYAKDLTNKYSMGRIPSVTYGDGDGTVNRVSLEECRKWSSIDSKFEATSYDKVSHTDIISNIKVMMKIGTIVGAPKRKKNRLIRIFR